MKILISNDDGYQSSGIIKLFEALKRAGHDVVMVAPERERSTTSHALTLHKPLRLVPVGERQYFLSGTPADCVHVGLRFDSNFKPDLVVSGINRGANLGMDIHYSGTVSCAREAVLSGVPAVAVSLVLVHDKTPEEVAAAKEKKHYEAAAQIVVDILPRLKDLGSYKQSLLNVNVPNLAYEKIKGVRLAALGERHYEGDLVTRNDPRGRPYVWIGGSYSGYSNQPGRDNDWVSKGFATLTPVNLEPTDRTMMEAMRSWGLERG